MNKQKYSIGFIWFWGTLFVGIPAGLIEQGITGSMDGPISYVVGLNLGVIMVLFPFIIVNDLIKPSNGKQPQN